MNTHIELPAIITNIKELPRVKYQRGTKYQLTLETAELGTIERTYTELPWKVRDEEVKVVGIKLKERSGRKVYDLARPDGRIETGYGLSSKEYELGDTFTLAMPHDVEIGDKMYITLSVLHISCVSDTSFYGDEEESEEV